MYYILFSMQYDVRLIKIPQYFHHNTNKYFSYSITVQLYHPYNASMDYRICYAVCESTVPIRTGITETLLSHLNIKHSHFWSGW